MNSYIKPSQQTQWWLAELDNSDNVTKLSDGAHSEARGAHEAFYLYQRLGLIKKDVKYAVVKCEVFEPIPDSSRANEDALNTLNGIGLK